ncbi:MAG: NAD(P)-dependent oxidoreductase [Proteobacteria bacterium]|nr:NAD(P)-dependent oxidoreductase [Pseudomonadota bacterium]
MPSTHKAAFIGLGNMGCPMAGHLGKAGFDVTVYNRTAAKAEAWAKEYGGAPGVTTAATPAEAAQGAPMVFTCVGNDDDLRAVVLGDDGALAGMGDGAILIDHTTASAIVAREIAEKAAEKGVGFLDAPVSGGQEGARNGALTVMVGGEEADFAKGEPAMRSYAKSVILMGPVGSGQLTKMVNQICCSCAIQALAEGMNFAVKAGLDAHQVVDVISKGAAQSWQMENRGKTMVDGTFDFGFAVDWMRKDLDICLDEARANGGQLPLTALIETFYARLQARGEGRLDNSALYRLLSDA